MQNARESAFLTEYYSAAIKSLIQEEVVIVSRDGVLEINYR